jgi:hypothetical protein
MTAALLSQLIQSLMALIGLVLTTLIGIYVPRAIAAFERKTGVIETDQQRAAIMSAVTTAKGLLETQIDQGLLKISDIRPDSPVIQQAAAQALDRVPQAAAAQGTTRDTMTKLIVARVDTSAKPVVVLPVAPVV